MLPQGLQRGNPSKCQVGSRNVVCIAKKFTAKIRN